jgi:pyrroline-5-carboxylate reductase
MPVVLRLAKRSGGIGLTAIALFGAGGKRGDRLANNLKTSRFDVRDVEVGQTGLERLKRGPNVGCVSPEAALTGAEVVVLAVPNTLIGEVAASIHPQLKAGAIVIALNAAAPFAGYLPTRPDLMPATKQLPLESPHGGCSRAGRGSSSRGKSPTASGA